MRNNSKKKGGPVRQIHVPAFEFEKANQYEQYYKSEIQISQEVKAGKLRSQKQHDDKIPSLLKPDESKKQPRLGSGRNNLLKPLEDQKLTGTLLEKQKFYEGTGSQWITDLSKKESFKNEKPARNLDRLNDSFARAGRPETNEMKKRIGKEFEGVDSPKKPIDQPSKNLKDYDCWGDDLEPEQWLRKYLGTPPPHGQSPIYSQGVYRWADIQLLNYDSNSGKFYVKVLENGLLKFVNRLSLKFKDEDPENFEVRVQLSKQRLKEAEEQTKLLKYIDNIPDVLVSEVPTKLLASLKTKKTEKDGESQPFEKAPAFAYLMEDFKQMHLTHEKRFLLHYPKDSKDLMLPQPLPSVADVTHDDIEIFPRYDEYDNSQNQISKNHVSKRTKEVKCQKLILLKGTEIIAKYPLWGELLQATQPMLLTIFQQKLEVESKNAIQSWTMIWRSHIISEIQDILKEEYRFFVTQRKLYDEDRLKKVITKFELLFNTVIRQNIFDGSIRIYMDFLKRYIVPNESDPNIYRINPNPLIILQLNVNEVKQKRKKRSKRPEKSKNDKDNKEKESKQIEQEVEEIIFFQPNLQAIEDTLTIPFDILHKFSLGFNKLEKDLLPLLNLEASPSYPVMKEDNVLLMPNNEVTSIIKQSFKKPQQILEDFKAFSHIMQKSPSSVTESVIPTDSKGNKINHNIMLLDREEIVKKLKEYANARTVIQRLANDQVNCGLFQVRTHGAKQLLVNNINAVIKDVLDRLKEVCADNVKRIKDKYESILQELKVEPKNEDELFQLKKVVSQNETEMMKIKAEVDQINRYLLLMEEYLYLIDDTTFENFWDLKSQPQAIKYELMEANHTISDKDQKFSETLQKQKDTFAVYLRELDKKLDIIKEFGDYSNVARSSTEVSLLSEAIGKAQEKIESFNKREELFKMAPSTYEDLDKLIQNFQPYLKLWTNSMEFDIEKRQCYEGPFLKLNFAKIQKRINQEFYRNCIQLTKTLDDIGNEKAQNVAAQFKKDIEKFRQKLWLIELLTTEALVKKPAYWKEIAKECNVDNIEPDELTLQSILNMGLSNFRQQIEQISKKAEKQWSLEKKLNSIVDALRNLRVEIMRYKNTGTSVVKGVDEVQQILDDQLNILLMMKASPYIKPIQNKVQTVQTKIINIQDTIDGWIEAQRGWMYLEPIFSSEDIKEKMKAEKLKFDTVDMIWRQDMLEFIKQPNLWEIIEGDKYKKDFDECNKLLDEIQKSLSQYLETKRRFFPRFYFLSDQELLQILAQTKDPETVQRHINKCFEAIAQLQFTPQQHVSAMISAEKERVDFLKNVDVNEGEKKGNVERWLSQIESIMISTLKKITKDSLNDQTERVKWVRKWPAQTVLAVNMIRWTQGAEHAIQTRTIKEFIAKLVAELKEIVVLVRQDLTELERLTLGALVTIDVHGKDVIEALMRDNCTDVQEFNWIAQLRYYWDESGKSPACKVKMINAELLYGFEYLGNSNRLVITPLTDRCYRTLMGAFHLYYGGAPEGPAGTGKTETVKDLAKALAVQCVVFNCSDGLNYIAMRKFFKGLASSGAWCCFDEFNRIDLEVLSVIAQQVLTIQTAIKERRRTFTFDGQDITLVLSCAINITMNPGYAGRSDLPDNLKALFRPCAMMVPDYAMIAEIYLYSVGFEEARDLARKIVASLRLSSEQLSSQDHYDFGMRALKAILTAAGNLKRIMANDTEDIVCLRALMDVNIPKFTVNDVPLFSSITSDLFPETRLPKIDYGRLLQSLKGYCHNNKLQPEEGFLNKCIQLFDTINVRHGLMVVGSAFSGKSKVIQTLSEGMGSLQGFQNFVKVQLLKLNPKSITSDQLYGKLDPNTKSWSDGVVAILMRKCAEQAEVKERKWVVFDGPVDAVWIENMNTVLDDNKKLCLTSGQIIKLTTWMTMMFEVEDLSQASPATVSRCGMVFLETKQLGWLALIKTFVLKLHENLAKYAEFLLTKLKFLVNISLAWIRKYGKFLVHRSEMTFVATLLKLLNTFIVGYGDAGEKIPKEMEDVLACLCVFCLVWSIGAALQETSRKTFNEFFNKLIVGETEVCEMFKLDPDYPYEANLVHTKLPEKPNYFEYFYSKEKQAFQNWSQTVPPFLLPKGIAYNDLLIPTVDSIRNNFFLHQNIKNKMHVLFSGPTGTGKSVQILNELYNHYYNQTYTFLSTSFSGQTIANQVQRLIESKVCTRRRRGIYGPEEGKSQIVIFIDDLNMPQKEKYGAQPPIQLLRQWMDVGGWYDLETKEMKYLCDINFVAAMLPSVGGRNVVTMRYLRHYNLIYVEPFESESLLKIFGSILEWYFMNLPTSLPKAITNLKDNIVSSTVELYNKVQNSKELLPTPAKSHYIYNLRDLSKVFQGITKANNRALITENDFIKLWAHECSRIFKDRLISIEDQNFFENMLKDIIKQNFKKEWSQLVTVEPLLWASFIPTIYPDGDTSKKPLNDVYCELTNRELVRKKCYEYLDEYNNMYSSNRMNLVLFMAAIEHIIKIVRVITTTFGHALLVGVGGSGRKSLAMLSTYIAFQTEYSQVNSKEWIEELQNVIKTTGLEQRPTVFMFSDTQIIKESMVQDICNLLNNGEVPNLFPPDVKETIILAITEIKPAGSPNQKYQYFVSLCKKFLHMIICMSPVGQDFRRRLRTFPTLVNCTTIDWFLPWPEEALISTADNHFLSTMNIQDESLRKGLVKICVDMQMRVTELTKRYYQELRRYYYVTPTSYLELLSTLHKLLKQRQDMIQAQIKRYETGVNKITTTEGEVTKMQKELEDLQPKLEKATIENKALLVNLQKSRAQADAKKAICQGQEKECNIQRDEANILRADCQRDLDEVIPLLEEAAQALDKITQDEMTQLKSYVNPPVSAAVVMEGVCYAFNEDQNIKFTPKEPGSMEKIQDFWGYSKKNLLNSKLIQRVKEFKQDKIKAIPPAKIQKLKQFILKPEFEKSKVFQASPAAGSLSMWIRAVIKTYDALLVVEPKKKQLSEAEEKLSKAEKILNEKKKALQQVLDLLAQLEAEYQQAKKKKDELQANVQKVKEQLQRAEKLIKGLAGQKIAWGKKVVDWGEESKGVLGDCVLCSGIIAYLGAFPITYRENTIAKWKQILTELGIRYAQKFSLQNVLSDPLEIGIWTNTQQLPNDDFSIDNAIILKNSSRWPLMIDPQIQANNWIKNMSSENLIVLRQNRPPKELEMKIESAMQFGYPVLLENIGETIDGFFEPVLQKKLIGSGLNLKIKFGDKTLDYAKEFRFFMTTKLARPHYPPEICVKVTVLNFQVTLEGLDDQMLNIVVSREQPVKEEQRQRNIKEFFDNKNTQKQIEDEILGLLNNSEGNLLDNVKLIQTLETSKVKAVQISEKMQKLEYFRVQFNTIRNSYKEVSKRVSNMYFVILDLAMIEPTYQWSLEFYVALFERAIQKAIPGRQNRCKNIIDKFQMSLYESICRSLLEKDKLIFSLLMCMKMLQSQGKITSNEIRFMMVGGTWTETDEKIPADAPWLSNKAWCSICQLSKSIPGFEGLNEDLRKMIKDWSAVYNTQDIFEAKMPGKWANLTSFHKLILIRIMRPDKFSQSVQKLITKEMGAQFIDPPPFNLEQAYNDSDAFTPLIFILSPGADPRIEITNLADSKGFKSKFTAISLGQGQGKIAQDSIKEAIKQGYWVLLQNCHLAPSFMPDLERIHQNMTEPNENFRIWLTSMPSNIFPVTILMKGIKMTYEPPRGLKNNLLRSFATQDKVKFEECKKPREWKKMFMGLSFFHALILERRKYGPLGWNIPYEFTAADFAISQSQLKMFLDEYENIPYEALNYMVAEANYGGRVTDPMDRRLIKIILKQFYSPPITEDGFVLSASGAYRVLDEPTFETSLEYIKTLPMNDLTEVFGLHSNAEISSAIIETNTICTTILSLLPRDVGGKGASAQTIIKEKIKGILAKLPKPFDVDEAAKKHPVMYEQSMNTVLQQQLLRFNKLLITVTASLVNVDKAIDGFVVMSQELEIIFNSLFDNKVPDVWHKVSYPSLKPLGSWINDFVDRLKFMQKWIDQGAPTSFWISGFFFTQSFLTGTLQNYARKYKIPIDTLNFEFQMIPTDSKEYDITVAPADGCYVYGLFIDGARWDEDKRCLNEALPNILFYKMPYIWLLPTEDKKDYPLDKYYNCPCYKTSIRRGTLSTTGHSTNYVLSIQLPVEQHTDSDHWVKRGVALLTQLDD